MRFLCPACPPLLCSDNVPSLGSRPIGFLDSLKISIFCSSRGFALILIFKHIKTLLVGWTTEFLVPPYISCPRRMPHSAHPGPGPAGPPSLGGWLPQALALWGHGHTSCSVPSASSFRLQAATAMPGLGSDWPSVRSSVKAHGQRAWLPAACWAECSFRPWPWSEQEER